MSKRSTTKRLIYSKKLSSIKKLKCWIKKYKHSFFWPSSLSTAFSLCWVALNFILYFLKNMRNSFNFISITVNFKMYSSSSIAWSAMPSLFRTGFQIRWALVWCRWIVENIKFASSKRSKKGQDRQKLLWLKNSL